ncbi:MAG TPA: pyridoxal phosphate-dependent aminotransferase [Caldithrix sp.]|nr:pyridoxal phosphate-dependent aminotransferase [Caldithrix sp.]
MKLSSRVSRIEVSKTLQVKEKALELKAQGVDVVDLTAGEPDFPTPADVARGGIQAIEEGFTHYTANNGTPELRAAIARKLLDDNGLNYAPEQIIVSNGAKQSIMNALFALAETGDEVVVALPYWVSYPQQIKLAGATPVFIDTRESNFKITPSLLEKHLTPNTKAIILNSPCNPTGAVYGKEELAGLAEVLEKHDLWIITDEIYEKIIFDGLKHVSIATFSNLIEKSVVINGFSKSHAMTGWRIGYAAAPLALVKAMSKIQSHYTSNASSISQRAALAALQGSGEAVENMRQTFEMRRDYIRTRLDSRPYFSYVNPQGAFYFFIKISDVFGASMDGNTISNSVDFCSVLTEKYHLVTVPGAAFGADDYIRISFAASLDEIEKAMDRLISGMDQLVASKEQSA